MYSPRYVIQNIPVYWSNLIQEVIMFV